MNEQTVKEHLRFLRLPEVVKLVGFSKPTIYLWISRGQFPRQRRIGTRSVVWLEKDVVDWIRYHSEAA